MKRNKLLKYIINLFEETMGDARNLIAHWIKGFRELAKNSVIRSLGKQLKHYLTMLPKELRRSLRKAQQSFKKKIKELKIDKLAPKFISILSIISIVFMFTALAILFQVGNRWDRNSYIVNIPKGYGANQVADLLQEMGIIDGKYGLNLLVTVFSLGDKIQAGTYMLKPNMPLITIVWKIKVGDIIPPPLVKITYPEGTSIYRMGTILAKAGVGDSQAFRKLTNLPVTKELKGNFSFLNGVKNNSLEGYLFPDTYFVPSNVTTPMLRDIMLSRFSKVVMPLWKKSKADTKYSFHEIITLASIIEKEAAAPEERTIISSVFHNRLDGRMYLAADPTIKYALSKIRKPTKRVYYIDLEVDSPYNTYKHLGLPPGPICNPGIESIRAAIYPAETDYLYFVAKKDGTHIFSTNWRDHEKARKAVRRM